MKTRHICFAALLSLSAPALAQNSPALSLQDAVNQGLAEVTIEGTGAGYYHDAVQIAVRNLTDRELRVQLEAGRMLDSQSPYVQDLVVVEMFVMNIDPRSEDKKIAQAMCVQMHNSSPSKGEVYRLRGRAGHRLTGLAQLIDQHDWFNLTSQQAVWHYSDKNDVGNIGGDSVQVRVLQEYIARVAGSTVRDGADVYVPLYQRPGKAPLKPEEVTAANWTLPSGQNSALKQAQEEAARTPAFMGPRSTEIREREYVPVEGSRRMYTINGTLVCEIPGPGDVRVAFFGPDGKVIEEIGTLPATQACTRKINYNFQHRVMLKGRYKVQAIQDGKVISELKYDLE